MKSDYNETFGTFYRDLFKKISQKKIGEEEERLTYSVYMLLKKLKTTPEIAFVFLPTFSF